MAKRIFLFLSLVFVCMLINACGSSGGSGDSSDSGEFRITLDPSRVLLGTITVLDLDFSNISFDDIDQEGITIKILISDSFKYVADSALLQISGGAVEVDPIFEGPFVDIDDDNLDAAIGRAEDLNYVVFSLTSDILQEASAGTLRISLSAEAEESSALIFVDIDRVAISIFDANDPAFDVEGDFSAEIVDSLD